MKEIHVDINNGNNSFNKINLTYMFLIDHSLRIAKVIFLSNMSMRPKMEVRRGTIFRDYSNRIGTY